MKMGDCRAEIKTTATPKTWFLIQCTQRPVTKGAGDSRLAFKSWAPRGRCCRVNVRSPAPQLTAAQALLPAPPAGRQWSTCGGQIHRNSQAESHQTGATLAASASRAVHQPLPSIPSTVPLSSHPRLEFLPSATLLWISLLPPSSSHASCPRHLEGPEDGRATGRMKEAPVTGSGHPHLCASREGLRAVQKNPGPAVILGISPAKNLTRDAAVV